MKHKLLELVLLLSAFLLGTTDVMAQGSTTSSMNGRVLDQNGQAVPGATVIAVHEPTGSQFGNVTDPNGNYRLNNMNVGGPYTISISFVGYETFREGGVFLDLGQTFRLNASLTDQVTELEEILIMANRGDIFDGNRTGSETIIDERAIMNAPTVDRNLQDFTRLTPQANGNIGIAGAISFGGLNNRYNSIYIDGAANNDLFGLADSGTNGGQTGISPISIDALEQFQVVLAPYDVRMGGFAGGGINVVTRSGSNKFAGSAYYLVNNEKFTGKTPSHEGGVIREKLAEFSNKTYGFRLGGPIIKNKLFFFVNAEIQRDETPQPFDADSWEGASGSGDSVVQVLNSISGKLRNDYGYEPGDFLNTTNTIDGEKFLTRLDWNINQNHKLMLRYHYTKAEQTGPPRPSSRTVASQNSNQFFPSTTNSASVEWKANFGNTASSNVIFGVTTVRDDRDVTGQPFPRLTIRDGDGTITTGAEPFSFANIVNQDVYTLTANYNLYKGRHTLTFGTHNEVFSIFNLFLPLHVPEYTFNSVDKFVAGDTITGVPEAILYLHGHAFPDPNTGIVPIGDNAESVAADFSTVQLGFYVQDEFQVNDRLKLTGGLRIDIPTFLDDGFNKVAEDDNIGFNDESNPNSTINLLKNAGYDLEGAKAGQLPDAQIHWSPRIGFNYDIKGDKTSQLRGGLGIFTSRIPYVWPGGVYLRNGLKSGFLADFQGLDFSTSPPTPCCGALGPGAGGVPFNPDLNSQPINSTRPVGDVDLFSKDFKFPQIFRASIGIDQQLPWWGLIGTLDFQYSAKVNDVIYTGVNKPKDPIGNLSGGPDNRPIYQNVDTLKFVDPTYNYITLATNTNEGRAINLTLQLTKPFDNGFTSNLGYSSTSSNSIYDNTVFINSSQWQELHSVNGRNWVSQPGNGNYVDVDKIQNSQFNTLSRITWYLSYRKEYAGMLASTIALFYNGQQGIPFSYVYNDGDGGLTNDDTGLDEARNLIYVPATQSDINLVDIPIVDDMGNQISAITPAEQWGDLDAFIKGDDYLSENRGGYAERNGPRMPWEHIIDLKFAQEIFLGAGNSRHTLALTFDIFNFTNMLGNIFDQDWGKRYFIADNQNFQLISLDGFESDGTSPRFTFQDPGEPWDALQSGTNSSRWSMRMGVRYTF